MRPPFAGIVLAGGASRRMGTDKALIDHDGRRLVDIALDALGRAGAVEVVAVGPRRDDVAATWIPDLHPGEGPLGGIITGLGAVSSPIAVTLPCDLLRVGPATVELLVERLDAHDVAVAVADREVQYLQAAWTTAVAPRLASAFESGARAVREAIDGLDVVLVDDPTPRAHLDADEPSDLRCSRHE